MNVPVDLNNKILNSDYIRADLINEILSIDLHTGMIYFCVIIYIYICKSFINWYELVPELNPRKNNATILQCDEKKEQEKGGEFLRGRLKSTRPHL